MQDRSFSSGLGCDCVSSSGIVGKEGIVEVAGVALGGGGRGINPLNVELNPICYLLALLAHHFLHVKRIRVKSLTLRLLMSYIYIKH